MSYWGWAPLLPGAALESAHTVHVTDTCIVVGTDVLNNVVRTDYVFIVIGLDDSAKPLIMANNPVTDSCAVQANDVTAVSLVGRVAADSTAVQASDTSPSITVVLSVSDSASIRAIDAYQPFPVTSVLDAFNRANEGPPPSSSWSNAFQASLQVVSNELVGGDISREGAAGWNTPFASVDLEMFTTIGSVALTDGGGPFALLFRMQVPNDYLQDHYRLKVQNSGGLGFIEIVRFQSGSGTSVGFSYLSGSIAVGDQIGVSVIGSLFRVYWKGSLVLSYTDSGITTGNYVGLWVITGLATTFDNFGGGPSAVGGASIVASVSAVESLAPHITESPSIASTISIADSMGISASDLVAILATGTIQDSLSVQASEGSTLIVSSTVASDTEAVQVAEIATVDTGSTPTTPIAATDSCAIQANEATPNVVQSASIGAVDSCAVLASEPQPLVVVTQSVPDSLAVQAVEVNVGPHAAVAQDVASIQSTEVLTNTLPTVASDTGSIALDEQPAIAAALSVTDTVAIQASEVATQQVSGASTPITASDSCALPIVDEIEPLRSFSVVDSNALILDERIAALAVPAEQVALMLLEQVRLEITYLEVIWGGGTRAEEARFLFAGSYRMGERNADETRGGTY